TVALLNSLRLTGHDEPLVALDCGLTDAQREQLAGAATIVPAPPVRAPSLAKWVAPLERPADVMALIDSDIVVVASLAPLLELAADGKVVAFADRDRSRFHPAWADALGATGVRRLPYVNGGFLLLPALPGRSILE